jgi:transcriptional regulator with XRE-family HTH domain
MKYGRAIRLARAARNMSKKELAEKANIDGSYISLIEQDRRVPSVNKIDAIAGALQVPVHLLALLGAEGAQLKNISSQEAEQVGRLLLDLLTKSSTDDDEA